MIFFYLQIITKVKPFKNRGENLLEEKITKIILFDYILFLIVNLMSDKEIK